MDTGIDPASYLQSVDTMSRYGAQNVTPFDLGLHATSQDAFRIGQQALAERENQRRNILEQQRMHQVLAQHLASQGLAERQFAWKQEYDPWAKGLDLEAQRLTNMRGLQTALLKGDLDLKKQSFLEEGREKRAGMRQDASEYAADLRHQGLMQSLQQRGEKGPNADMLDLLIRQISRSPMGKGADPVQQLMMALKLFGRMKQQQAPPQE